MPSLNLRAALKRNPNRPTLKQRAAALKATAGRVMRRRPAEVAPAASVADPRLAATVAELLEARRKLNDPSVPDGPEADALGERETALSMEVYRFPARSIHDVAAKLPFFREEAEDAGRAWDVRRGEVFENSLPGAAWAGLLRDIEHLAGAAPAAETAPDPILAAIEASKAAQAARDAWAQRFNGGARLSSADFAEEDRLNGVQSLAHDTVIATVPTTAAGRLALLDYLRWQMGLYGMADGNPPDAGSAFWPDAYKALKAALAFDGQATRGPSSAQSVSNPHGDRLDLSGCSVRDLARLYETLSAHWRIASVTMGAPFLWNGDDYTAAGHILDAECDRLARILEDIAREIAGREAGAEEQDDQLAVQVRQEFECNGGIYDPALLARINAAWGA